MAVAVNERFGQESIYGLSPGTKKVAVVERCSLGTLSNEDDDGSENVTEKMNLRSFNLIASIRTRSICQMQATFPGIEFLRSLFRFKKRKENSSSYVHVLHKRQIRRFHVVVVQWTPNKCTKKHDAREELLF